MFIILNDRQMCDLELLLNGSFKPLNGFMVEKDYNSVLNNYCLDNGEIFTLPIVLSINQIEKDNIINNSYNKIILKNKYFEEIALLYVEDIFKPDLINECNKIFGCSDENHPYIKIILKNKNVFYVGGKIKKIKDVYHSDFNDIRLSPFETIKYFKDNNWKTIVGFQTRNPSHKSHIELTKYAMNKTGDKNAKLLFNPVVGITQDCDVNYHTRVKCYKKIIKLYEKNTALLSLLNLSMRMAGPREAILHAIIRKNYGCTHFIVGRDHAGPSFKKKDGKSFFGPYDAHDLFEKLQNKLGIKMIKSKLIGYVKEIDNYLPQDELKENQNILTISGTKFREYLENDKEIPSWFSFEPVIKELKIQYKPKHLRGFCIYMVGLSGAGKTTTCYYLKNKLKELDSNREISILDGDEIRTNLSKGLGFTKEDRSINVRRIGYVASKIVQHNGIVLCANIAPYEEDRNYNRTLISNYGQYIEVYLNTKLKECENRDVKGLYKKVREGKIKKFTGINDPFEVPLNPELVLNCSNEIPISQNINSIISFLRKKNYLL